MRRKALSSFRYADGGLNGSVEVKEDVGEGFK